MLTAGHLLTCRTQNSDVPRAEHLGSAQGDWAGQDRAKADADVSVRLEHNRPLALKSIENNPSSLKPGHTMGGTVRGGAQRNDRFGRERAAQEADGTVRLEEHPLIFHTID